MHTDHLFDSGKLSEYLRKRAHAVRERLLSWSPDYVLGTSDIDLIEQLKMEALIECPVLVRDRVSLEEPVEEVRRYIRHGDTFSRRVTSYTLIVPFTGHANVFRLEAQTYSTSPPKGELASNGQQILLKYDDERSDGAEIRSHFDRTLDEIETILTWARDDIRQHQWNIEHELPRLVDERRTKLLNDRKAQEKIGFPIKRRDDAASYTVPIERVTFATERTQSSPRSSSVFKPEPALADNDYESALAVLRNARNALERTPSVAAGWDEEEIRNFLLIFLNAQFKGQAAGEVFNRAGKTDILIRTDDANIFIGECKIWKGPKTISNALDQLLGYLVWRDTKAALLLFIRDGDISAVMQKAVAQVETHPNYKSRGQIMSEERHDFIIHAKDDSAREIQLALLPFLIPKR
ncbi:hypothetical protein [Umezawaea tangerina]|uniref:Restriction endonuclease n=1 Tax=Umezawaea tangerina TaxID=84725 RepID=A0A2T0T7Q3_9PSEU|nr:hypothetical protein [Umezawaea tangerina]PRY41705.1 hypothetical protein CLV43_105463 [Umezawaea tangerina]